MKSQSGDNANLSRPRYKSVEAYKVWILEIAQPLTTGSTTIEFTEVEWIANWKENYRSVELP
jgi:hypothetical protein